MQALAWFPIFIFSVLCQAVLTPNIQENKASSVPTNLIPRDDDEFDPTDLSGIKSLAAIGDSYSAGIGAGNRLGDFSQMNDDQSDYRCSRYDHSYPYLLYNNSWWGGEMPNFQFRSCSGAVAQDVLDYQIPVLNSNQDAILLSIGGNDVGLTSVLNQCIYQFASINSKQVDVGKLATEYYDKYGLTKSWDWDALGRGCQGQLLNTSSLISSTQFSTNIDAVVNAAKAKLAPGGHIYWTGYAKFFGEDMSPDCDNVTWTTWIHKTYNIFLEPEYLTVSNRKAMNSLVDQMNAQLEAAAKRAGPSVVFVNYDSYVGDFGGRYCEPGVDESTSESNTRVGLMFYELNTWDPLGTSPWKRSDDDPEDVDRFSGDINTMAQITSFMDPDARFANSEANTVTTDSHPGGIKINTVKEISEIGFSDLIPNGYGRIFHPQILLHQIIANLIEWNMMNVREISNGYQPLPEQLDIESCPVVTDTKAPDFYARILPLGASIVWGKGSSTGNGFRKPVRDALRQVGWKVNMVGSKHNGNMVDYNVEAHSGDRVDEIQTASTLSTKYQPNIIIINGGTNDCLQFHDIPNFSIRYNSLLDSLYSAIPNVTIIVSTVIPGTAYGIPQNRDAVNSQIRSLTSDRQQQGQKIILADVDQLAGFFTTEYLISDGIHPTDEGHRRLAAIYVQAIEEANGMNFLSPPRETGMSDEPGGPGDNTCYKTYASGESHGAKTQQGSGLDDGIYIHNSVYMGGGIDWPLPQDVNLTFARIITPFGNDDMVEIGELQQDEQSTKRVYHVWSNIAHQNSLKIGSVLLADTCIARGVRFVDVNADGLDDMVCVAVDGDAYVSINRGNYQFSDGGLWKGNEKSPQDRVLLADIDGDGRADYCTIADNGDISCWRNGGQGDLPDYWQKLGVIFTGKGFGDVHGVRFADLNGDGRDDWTWMDDTGKTWTYTNSQGCTRGTLEPLWRAGENALSGKGYTHAGMGKNVRRNSIHFAKVYGEPEAFSLGGRADYVWVEDLGQSDVSSGVNNYKIHIWQNKGSGATKLKADGDRYCNMLGHSNGAMDYVWVHSTGYMILYESFGGQFPAEPPFWGPNYQIWAASDHYSHDIDRRDLHLADWDGDGLCDIIYVDPGNGEMDVWLNQYKKGGDITKWVQMSNAGPSGKTTPCPEKRGVGIHDLAVRFADIDGNGRADYLCIEKDGRTWGYLNNKDGSLEHVEQFKKTEGKDRANLRWVDVNGDGKDDMIWVDKFFGDGTVWYNQGPIPASGSAFTWENKGLAYQGAGQGPCQVWPDLNGDGRADMSLVHQVENSAWTWFNLCPNEGGSHNGDDPDTLTSPPLPPL